MKGMTNMEIRYFKDCDGETIDLGNIDIYSERWKDKEAYELWQMGWAEAGKSLFYMEYLNADIDWGKQRERINKLCIELVVIREWIIEDSPKNRLRMMNWLYRFEDEVENQC